MENNQELILLEELQKQDEFTKECPVILMVTTIGEQCEMINDHMRSLVDVSGNNEPKISINCPHGLNKCICLNDPTRKVYHVPNKGESQGIDGSKRNKNTKSIIHWTW